MAVWSILLRWTFLILIGIIILVIVVDTVYRLYYDRRFGIDYGSLVPISVPLSFSVVLPHEVMMTHSVLHKIPKEVVQSWRRHHPDLRLCLLDDSACQAYIRRHGSDMDLELFAFLQDGPIKADFFRVFYLYHHGGVYADADMQVFATIHDYLAMAQQGKFVTVKAAGLLMADVSNPTFVVVPRHHVVCQQLLTLYRIFFIKKIAYRYWTYSIVKMINRLVLYTPDIRHHIVLPLYENVPLITAWCSIYDVSTHKRIFKNKVDMYTR